MQVEDDRLMKHLPEANLTRHGRGHAQTDGIDLLQFKSIGLQGCKYVSRESHLAKHTGNKRNEARQCQRRLAVATIQYVCQNWVRLQGHSGFSPKHQCCDVFYGNKLAGII